MLDRLTRRTGCDMLTEPMANSTDLINRASDYLASEETIHSYEPRGIHLVHDSATHTWILVDDDDLESLGEIIASGSDDAYLVWCRRDRGVEVDLERVVLDFDANEDTDLDALATGAGAADDMPSFMALTFLADELWDIITTNEEIAGENAGENA